MGIDDVTAGLFRRLSDARDARVFHPRGVLFRARWEPVHAPRVIGDSPLVTGEHDALVRFSRAVGVPAPAPDILGVAIKVLDVHGPGRDQDLLLASSGNAPVLRRLLLPMRDFGGTTFSSLLPYAVGDGRALVTASAAAHRRDQLTYAAIEDGTVDPPMLTVELRTLAGRRVPVATVVPGERLSPEAAADIRFDPWHTGRSLRPTGLLNRLRRPAYQASQEGRDAPDDGVRDHLAG